MRTGRPPEDGSPRSEVVCVRLTAEDVQNLDRLRGVESRSGFFRNQLRATGIQVGARRD